MYMHVYTAYVYMTMSSWYNIYLIIIIIIYMHSASPSLDANFHSDVHGCQLGHQVAEDVGHIDDLHPPSSLTHPALPAPLRLREGRELRWRAR